jgi:hypothetical protein
MTSATLRYVLGFGLVLAGLLWNGEILPTSQEGFITTADARVGRPATPVSYAGVARRSTVGAGAPGVGVAPGVGAGGVGGPASGVGVLPGAGAGQAGVGPNVGGPVNRVGVR